MKTPIIITPGEPAGIGPDIVLRFAAETNSPVPGIVIADPDLLRARAKQCHYDIDIHTVDTFNTAALPNIAHRLSVFPVPLHAPCEAGLLNAENASYVLACLDIAIAQCLQQNAHALVTGPIHKGIINEAGIAFTGHTEYLATHTQTPTPVMCLASDDFRIALATTHIPLKNVSAAITESYLIHIIETLHKGLQQQYAIEAPHIFVSGLNPHAGEDGHLGTEEIDVIIPAIKHCEEKGIRLTGPLSADTLFSKENRKDADVFLVMFHDQGLPVIKSHAFGSVTNITLGLPFIRTSVDHGTALSLAGTGEARSDSLKCAIAHCHSGAPG